MGPTRFLFNWRRFGVRAFREPTVRNAQRTLTVVIGLLAVLLAGIAYLVRAYGIQATDPGKPGYQSVVSMLVAAVTGRGWFYYFAIGSVLLILSLSANTAFADFPRLCIRLAIVDAGWCIRRESSSSPSSPESC